MTVSGESADGVPPLGAADAVAGPDEAARRGQRMLTDFEQSGDLPLLRRAVALLRAAAAQTLPYESAYPSRLDDLGCAVAALFEEIELPELLDEAVHAFRAAVGASYADDADLPMYQSHLANALRLKFGLTGDDESLAESVRCQRAALEVAPPEHEARFEMAILLSVLLTTRFERSGGVEQVHEAIAWDREAIARARDAAEREYAVNTLVIDLSLLHQAGGEPGDETVLRALIEAREALAELPADPLVRADRLDDVRIDLLSLHRLTGDVDAVNRAVTAARRALDLVPADHPERSAYLTSLALALAQQHEASGDQNALRLAINIGRAAAQAAVDADDRRRALHNLRMDLRTLRDLTEGAERSALLREIAEVSRALVAFATEPAQRAERLDELRFAAALTYDDCGEQRWLDEALAAARAAIELVTLEDAAYPGYAFGLARILHHIYRGTGDASVLREEVPLWRSGAARADGELRRQLLAGVILSVNELYEATDDGALLSELAEAYRAWIPLLEDPVSRAICLDDLSSTLLKSYIRNDEESTLVESIAAAREALATLPEDRPERASWLNGLVLRLRALSQRTGVRALIFEIADAARATVAATAADDSERSERLTRLATALEDQYDATKDAAPLREAIEARRSIAAALPPDGPALAAELNQIAALHGRLAHRFGDADAARESITAARTAARLPAEPEERDWSLALLATSLRVLHGLEPDPELVREAVATRRLMLQELPPDAPDRSAVFTELGKDLVELWKSDLSLPPAQEALWAYRNALNLTAPDDPDYQYRLNLTAVSAIVVAVRSLLPEDLAEALRASEAALRASAVDDEDAAILLSELARLGLVRYLDAYDESDLHLLLRSAREGIGRVGVEHFAHGVCRGLLATGMYFRFERTREPDDLDAALSAVREYAAVPSADDARELAVLGPKVLLGLALGARFTARGGYRDLVEAIDALTGEATRPPSALFPQEPLLASVTLGNLLVERFTLTGAAADLDDAITALDRVVSAADVLFGTPEARGYVTFAAASASARRHSQRADVAGLDADLATMRACFDAGGPRLSADATLVSMLGSALLSRTEFGGGREYLDECVSRLRRSDEPDSAVAGAYHASLLAMALTRRFELDADADDLTAAETAARRAVRLTPDGHSYQATYLSHLASILRVKSRRSGSPEDLHEAITLLEAGIAASFETDRARRAETGPDAAALDGAMPSPQAQLNRFNLGGALLTRYEASGALADLDDAIAAMRPAIGDLPMRGLDHDAFSPLLAGALRMRSAHTGSLADANAAVAAARTADGPRLATGTFAASSWESIGLTLLYRANFTDSSVDLDAAVDAFRKAVAALPAKHMAIPSALSSLCMALAQRHAAYGRQADLDEMLAVSRTMLVGMDPADPNLPMCLLSRAIALTSAADTLDSTDAAAGDFDEAIDACRAALRALRTGARLESDVTLGLAQLHERRYDRSDDSRDRSEAVAAYEQVVRMPTAPAHSRIEAARSAAKLLRPLRPGRAAGLLVQAVALLPEVSPRRLGRGDRQFGLGRMAGLATRAAAVVLEAARQGAEIEAVTAEPDAVTIRHVETSEHATGPALALQLLEAGRAVLLNQALELRGDLGELREVNPALADRFAELRELLDAEPEPGIDPAGIDSTGGNTGLWDAEDRRDLAAQFAALLEQIRALKDFERFGRAPSVEELLAEASEGPIVVLNVSVLRADAILLTEGEIRLLPLPAVTWDAVEEKTAQLRGTLLNARDTRDPRDAIVPGPAVQGTLDPILTWLWDAIAGPVLDALGYHATPPDGAVWPRIWWVLPADVALLPLHAAGHHADPPGPGHRTLLDRVVSSYTPSIRALRHARRRSRPQANPSSMIVAMPTTPGLRGDGRLDSVRDEARVLAGVLPRPLLFVEPDPQSAAYFPDAPTPTRDEVLDALPQCTIAHFACHGTSSPSDPSRSMLLLHDHQIRPLTVARVSALALDRAQLAYLSACSTATNHVPELGEEAIHLAAAFQLAGFPQVIGTLWPIDDRLAVQIARSFYAQLVNPDTGVLDPARSAVALHRAVRSARDSASPYVDALTWAAYLHSGA